MSAKYRQMCQGKKKYSQQRFAEYARSRVYQSGRVMTHLNIYACPFCGNWHMGHGPPDFDDEFHEESRRKRRSKPRKPPPEIEEE